MEALFKKTSSGNVGANTVRQQRAAGTVLKQLGGIVFDRMAIIIFLVIWEIAPRVGWVPQTFISPPSLILETLVDLIVSGVLFVHIKTSLLRSVFGFILSVAIGIPLGLFLGGWFPLFERVMNPVLRLLSAINPFSLFPVFILIFGIGEVSKVAMIFWVCLWPVVINTTTGIQSVDGLLIKSARSMGVVGSNLFFKVIFPASLPGIFHGLRTACSVAFFMLIAAEMVGASSGLGWLVFNAQNNYQIPKLFATTFTIAALGLSLNGLFGLVERRLLNWKETTADY